jgi:hypothetical protein
LRGGIVENILVGGKEQGGGFAAAGFDSEAETLRRGLEGCLGAGGERLGNAAAQALEKTGIGSE